MRYEFDLFGVEVYNKGSLICTRYFETFSGAREFISYNDFKYKCKIILADKFGNKLGDL